MPCKRFQFGDGSVALLNVPDEYHIRAGGEEFHFEFNTYTGPSMIGKSGNPIQAMPPNKSPFWDALYWWLKQGKQVGEDGYCVFKWEMQPVNILKHLGGRHYKVLA